MILLLGGTGYVGTALHGQLLRQGRPFRVVSRAGLDYTKPENLRRLLRESAPSFLINCAGYTGKPNVDACESNKEECLRANGTLPGLIREACAEIGLPWGHISSGCIFTGFKALDARGKWVGFTEEDPPTFGVAGRNKGSYYSQTKVMGEQALGYRDAGDGFWRPAGPVGFYVWRLRMPFNSARHPRNYLFKVASYPRLLNVRNSPSQMDEFAGACLQSWERRIPFGIYNVTNPGSITTSEIAGLMKEENASRRAAGRAAPFPDAFDFFENEDEFMRTAVITPRSSCELDSGKLRASGIRMTPIHEAVARSLREWEMPGS
jgi:dTDP-4-dehydrorhamnose reductase